MREACSTWNMALPEQFHLRFHRPIARGPSRLLADTQAARFTAMSGQYASIKAFPKGQKMAIWASLCRPLRFGLGSSPDNPMGIGYKKTGKAGGFAGHRRRYPLLSAGHQSPWDETKMTLESWCVIRSQRIAWNRIGSPRPARTTA